MATDLKPAARRSSCRCSVHVHGTRNTDPIDTLTARLLSGSHESAVTSTASMPSAAAERKMAPMLVLSTTPSITATLWASPHTSLTVGMDLRRMAHSTPRVRV